MQLSLFKGISNSSFLAYHHENKHVYQAFKRLTLKTIAKGFSNYSAKGIFEVLRWETGVSETGGEFKINNNYTPYYARMFMNEYPQYEGFFRLRKSKADKENMRTILSA